MLFSVCNLANPLSTISRRLLMRDVPLQKAPVGLRNQGNDCCFIAAVQFLYHTPSLKQLLSKQRPLALLLQAYSQAKEASALCLPTRLFREKVTIADEPDHYLRQTDPMGYIRAFADSANHSLTLRSKRLGQASYLEKEGAVLGLTIPSSLKKPSLHQLLKDYFEPSTTESKAFVKAPQDLVVCSQRFCAIRELCIFKRCLNFFLFCLGKKTYFRPQIALKKVCKIIETPLNFTLDKKWVEGNNSKLNYSCQAFICHQGSSLDHGHFISYVQVKGEWWECNDSRIIQVSNAVAQKALQSSYVISYRKD